MHFDTAICSFYYPVEAILARAFGIGEPLWMNLFMPDPIFSYINGLYQDVDRTFKCQKL